MINRRQDQRRAIGKGGSGNPCLTEETGTGLHRIEDDGTGKISMTDAIEGETRPVVVEEITAETK